MPSERPVEARGLVKRYGAITAVDHVDLTVEPGDVYGFLGPNGAGKTTTLRILLGLIRPDSGEARLFGRDPQHELPEARLGAAHALAQCRGARCLRAAADRSGRVRDLPLDLDAQQRRLDRRDARLRALDGGDRRARAPALGQHYLLSDQFDGWHGLFMSPIDWTLIARAAWVSAIFAAVPLALA
jgi:ATPase subunit of ABC transporter with duplicated ATPase domains